MQVINAEFFTKQSREIPVIDVRSPAEFALGHIPAAVNIPVFDDRERAVIGTLYCKEGRNQAIETGLEIIGPKMAELARKASRIAHSGKLLVHCWRGGMRSESMAWLFERLGIKCSVLEGGYKAYRNFLLKETGSIPNLIVIEGPTGSGKTEILSHLRDLGEQTIDLEDLAQHKGSVFGGIGKDVQPSTQQFQNNLLEELMKLDKSRRIWVEGESRTIGKVFLPDSFHQCMAEAAKVAIVVPRSDRIDRLIREYGDFPQIDMSNAINSLAKRIGEVRKNEILDDYNEGRLENVAHKLLDYYDKMYRLNCTTINKKRLEILLPDGNSAENAKILVEKLTKSSPN